MDDEDEDRRESYGEGGSPLHVIELAGVCSRLVARALGVELDGKPETLPLLDHYLREMKDESPGASLLVASAAGAYFGELVRSQYPCRWHAPVDDYGAWRIEFAEVFLHFNPVAFAHEAMASRDVIAGGTGFGVLENAVDIVRAGLDALGSISEEDYFRLSTRFEVLGTVVDRLTGAALAGGEPASRYNAAEYREALDEPGEQPS